jgi:hypothetical protein
MNVVMKKSKAPKAASVSEAPAVRKPADMADGLWDRIARKAYELWDATGRREGSALQDWLDAEQIVMDEMHEARE